MADSKNRFLEIDIVKCMGIVLVVIAHTFGAGFLALKFYCMPLYFFVGGVFFPINSTNREFAKKTIIRLYIPFILYELVFLLLTPLFLRIGFLSSEVENLFTTPEKIIHILLIDNVNMLLSPFWFVTALFFSRFLVYYLLRVIEAIKCKQRRRKMIYQVFAVGLIYLGLLMGRYDVMLIPRSYNFAYGVGVTIEATGYGLAGIGMLDDMKVIGGDQGKKYRNLFLLIPFFSLVLFERLFRPIADMRLNDYTIPILQPFFAQIGIIGLFIISHLIAKVFCQAGGERLLNIIAYIGQHSFSIMSLHPLAIKLVGVFQVYILGSDKSKLADWQLVSYTPVWRGIYCLFGIVFPLVLV